MSEEVPKTRRELITLIFKIAFLEAMALSLILPSVISTGEIPSPFPLATTYLVKAPSLNTYQAFVSGGSGSPIFTESNFTFLINNDIFTSKACSIGCSIHLNDGIYNETQTTLINMPKISFDGSTSAIVRPQNVTGWNASLNKAAFALSSTNTVLRGFTIDDASRVGTLNTGDSIYGTPTSSSVLIDSLTVQNSTSDAVNIQGSNYIITLSTLQGPIPPAFTTNYGILMGSTTKGVRIDKNSISRFNYTDTSAIQSSNGASFISITGNDLFANSFGVSSTWGKFLTISGNTIHNNYAAGVLLTTSAVSSVAAGPAVISGNTITDNALEPNNDVICNSGHCPGIMIRGTRPSWDSVAITGNTIKDTQASPTQKYDINIISTQYSNLTITGNSLGRTSSGIPINIAVTPLASWLISANSGVPLTIRGPLTAGATPFTYFNNDPYMEQLEIITIGDMTNLSCKGIAEIIQVDAVTPVLNMRDSCIFTYIVNAPTYDILPIQG